MVKDLKKIRFTKMIRTSGGLQASFVFENQKEVQRWIKEDLPKLEAEYNKLSLEVSDLPGLRVGDKCKVWGEGNDVFVIEDIKIYSKDRYGFGLDSGWWEEVAKCY